MDSTGWDERYAATELVWSAEPNLFLPPAVADLDPGSALDVACGEGRNAIWLAEQGWDVVGIDFSPVAIDKARQRSGATEVEWVVGDVLTYDPGRTFDLIIIFYLHLEPEAFAQVMDQVTAMLAPGGTLFGVGHAVRNLHDGVGGPPVAEILWAEEPLRDAVVGLDVIELGERLRTVSDVDRPAIDMVLHATKPS